MAFRTYFFIATASAALLFAALAYSQESQPSAPQAGEAPQPLNAAEIAARQRGRGAGAALEEPTEEELAAAAAAEVLRRGGRGGRLGRGARLGGGRVIPPANRTTDLMLSEFPCQAPYVFPYAKESSYYLFSAAHESGGRATVVAYKSKDLKIWEGPQTVFAVPDGIWANPRDGAFSPEVHEYKGMFYLLVTLQNRDAIFAEPPQVWRPNHLRGTVIAQADAPTGPYELLRGDGPFPPREFMTLDGTLYVDPAGRPWMVYCHDWTQVIDGMIEAVPLAGDLSGTEADPSYLFKASDGPWLAKQEHLTADERMYVANGPELFRTKDNHLLMLWSTHTVADGYIVTVARSTTGQLAGPWEQLEPLVKEDGGNGMLFRTFDGRLMLALEQPYGQWATARLFDVEDAGDHLQVVKHRDDLDTRPAGRRPTRQTVAACVAAAAAAGALVAVSAARAAAAQALRGRREHRAAIHSVAAARRFESTC